jgi:hypothetical protein
VVDEGLNWGKDRGGLGLIVRLGEGAWDATDWTRKISKISREKRRKMGGTTGI